MDFQEEQTRWMIIRSAIETSQFYVALDQTQRLYEDYFNEYADGKVPSNEMKRHLNNMNLLLTYDQAILNKKKFSTEEGKR